jgi:hypothetical protein
MSQFLALPDSSCKASFDRGQDTIACTPIISNAPPARKQSTDNHRRSSPIKIDVAIQMLPQIKQVLT